MNLGRLTDMAKDVIAKRGGTESVKEDAAELRDIAKRPGSTQDKLKDAASALREPGARADRKRRPPQRPGS
jgi:hypothetical protein